MSLLCPICDGETHKVIYMGLPGRLCFDGGCCCLTGLAAYAPPVASETWDGPMFAFMIYDGSYWVALFRWLFAGRGEE
jgi:hypothetical protein